MTLHFPGPLQVVITTPAFVAGQEAARADFGKDPWLTPNWDLLDRLVNREFAAGYRYEFTEYIATHPEHNPPVEDLYVAVLPSAKED
jgi:hypothetical protein